MVEVKSGMLVAPVAPVPTPVVCVALLQLKVNEPPVAPVPVAGLSAMAAWLPPLQVVVAEAAGAVAKVTVGTTV